MFDRCPVGLIEYARTFNGVHYKYGGNHPDEGLDCSGFACILLRREGILRYNQDKSSQDLYWHLEKDGKLGVKKPGAFVFFGRALAKIRHVAMLIDSKHIIESGGGDSTTVTQKEAIKRLAMVREMPLNYRKDLIAIVVPNYRACNGSKIFR